MLIQFSATNVLSFKDKAVLDLSSVNAYKEHSYNLTKLNDRDSILKVAAIYGANASGKSNFHQSMQLFQKIIAESIENKNDDGSVAISRYYVPFLFVDEKKESEFEMICADDEFEYTYGFAYTDTSIISEWLYRKSFKTNRTSTILERAEDEISFGSVVRTKCEIYKNQIPGDTLVLSFFNKLKSVSDVFSVVYKLCYQTLVTTTDLVEHKLLFDKYIKELIDQRKIQLLAFIQSVDLGIVDITYKEVNENIIFYTTHLGRDNKEYRLNLLQESEGTIKSIALYNFIITAVMEDLSIFIDELNTKLHPLLLKQIIDIFHSSDTKGQLIYTTHDTTLLDKKFFRRDQIWFVEKSEYGESELTALSDFKIRSDSSFEKDYLAGVYGGIPSITSYDIKGQTNG